MANKHLGKLPAQPARPHLSLADHLTGEAAPPASVDFTAGTYPMLGNDNYGDCVEAGICHQVSEYTRDASGTEVTFTDDDALGLYSAITGFDKNDPSTDQGTYTQDAMTYWRKTGVKGHEVTLFASLKLADLASIKQAVATFGAVGIGFNFPESAMDQFDAGQPWTVVKNSPIEGGHYVVAVGYDATYLEVLTWGAVQKMAWSFFAKYADEAWVVVTPEMVSQDGVAAFTDKVDLYGLGEDFAALTGQSNPFPDVQPPAPTPDPTPAPGSLTAQDVANAVVEALTDLDLTV